VSLPRRPGDEWAPRRVPPWIALVGIIVSFAVLWLLLGHGAVPGPGPTPSASVSTSQSGS
jgi:hypothetical protein